MGKWLGDRAAEGVPPHETGVFAVAAAKCGVRERRSKPASLTFAELTEKVETTAARISIGSMNSAKGLEFRAVAINRLGRRRDPAAAADRERRR